MEFFSPESKSDMAKTLRNSTRATATTIIDWSLQLTNKNKMFILDAAYG